MSTQTQGVILSGRPSAVPIVAEWIAVGLFLLFVDLLVLPLFQAVQILSVGWIVFTLLAMLAVMARGLVDLAECLTYTVTLTRTHLICEFGLLNRDYDKIPVETIQTIHLRYALLGRILDYGNLEARTLGGRIKIRNLHHPRQWLANLERLHETSRRRNPGSGPQTQEER